MLTPKNPRVSYISTKHNFSSKANNKSLLQKESTMEDDAMNAPLYLDIEI